MTPRDLARKRKWSQRLRAERRKLLLCIRCGARTNGLSHCEACRKKKLEGIKALKRARRKAGLCRCGGTLPPGFGRCDKCREAEAATRRMWKARQRELNRQRHVVRGSEED